MNVYLLVQTNDDIRVESISQKMYILFLCRSGCSEEPPNDSVTKKDLRFEIQRQDHNWQLTPSISYTKPGGPKLILNVKQAQLSF